MFSRNDLVSATIDAARRYRNSSIFSRIRSAVFCRTAPTAAMLSGHRSEISSTKGLARTAASAQPATAAKNWGEVAAITSGSRGNSPATNAVVMKERKSSVLRYVPALAVMNVLTRMTRMPEISSV